MGLSDTWHRTLVFFGIGSYADEYEDEDTSGVGARPMTADAHEPEEERPNVRRLSSRRRRDEIDEIFGDESLADRQTRVLRPVSQSRPVPARPPEATRVHLVVPRSFNDAQDVADKFKDAIPVIINLQGADSDLSKRLIDFASGLTYALDGGMQRIADKVFLLTPRNVEVSAEEKARLLEKGFFNQS
ncbi:MAG: cell division protein SepF [Actinomycetota bacterium]|nr:cell division protein SepF [Actinomycetota bacterium]